MKLEGYVAHMGKRNTYRILVGEREGMKLLRRFRPQGGNNIKMYLRDTK
jgi:hypothetical protein